MGNPLAILLAPFKFGWWCLKWLVYLSGIAEKAIYRWITGAKESGTHGSARWADKKDLKPFFEPQGFLISKVEGKSIYTGAERNVMICAPPGQGKSRMMAAMAIDRAKRQQPCDVIIADPAGDIEALTREHFVKHGYKTRTLNIISPGQTECYLNPFRYFSGVGTFHIEGRTDHVAMLLSPDDAQTRESHFQDTARNIVHAALIRANSLDEPISLYELIETLTDAKSISKFFQGSSMVQSIIVKQQQGVFDAVGDKERGSFMSTLGRKLKPFATNAARFVLSENGKEELNFRDMYSSPERHVTFIRGGLGNFENGAIVRLVLGLAIHERAAMWNEGQRFNKDLEFYVDETKLLGDCQALQILVDTLRKARCRVAHTWLSFGDVKKTMKGYESFVGASELAVFGGGRDMDFYEQASKTMGDMTIQNKSINESEYGESQGLSEQARRLMKADEYRYIPPDEVVFTIGVLNVRGKKLMP